MKAIQVSCKGSGVLPLAEIRAFQGNLKSLSESAYAKLRGLILKNGITQPISVWKDPKGRYWNLDGHQRALVLGKLEKEESFKLPPIPVVHVKASSIKQAREILISNASQYGRVERQGLYEFASEAGFDYAQLAGDFELPGIDMKSFGQEFFDVPIDVSFQVKPGATEIAEGEFSEFDHRCPKCKFEWNDPK